MAASFMPEKQWASTPTARKATRKPLLFIWFDMYCEIKLMKLFIDKRRIRGYRFQRHLYDGTGNATSQVAYHVKMTPY